MLDLPPLHYLPFLPLHAVQRNYSTRTWPRKFVAIEMSCLGRGVPLRIAVARENRIVA